MTKDVAWLSAILIELFAANVKAPSPPADKVKSPAMSTAPEKSPVAASSSPLIVKLPELSNVNTALLGALPTLSGAITKVSLDLFNAREYC